jgi:hypothetical protein
LEVILNNLEPVQWSEFTRSYSELEDRQGDVVVSVRRMPSDKQVRCMFRGEVCIGHPKTAVMRGPIFRGRNGASKNSASE